MKLIYVAGRYRADTLDAIDLNIQAAKHVGLICVEKGWYPVIPHMNTAGFERHLLEVTDAFYLHGTMELMLRCDAVVLVSGYSESRGTSEEIKAARRANLPIFDSVDMLAYCEDGLLYGQEGC